MAGCWLPVLESNCTWDPGCNPGWLNPTHLWGGSTCELIRVFHNVYLPYICPSSLVPRSLHALNPVHVSYIDSSPSHLFACDCVWCDSSQGLKGQAGDQVSLGLRTTITRTWNTTMTWFQKWVCAMTFSLSSTHEAIFLLAKSRVILLGHL